MFDFTHRTFDLKDKIPSIVRKIIERKGSSSLFINEYSALCYPYVISIFDSPLFEERFDMQIETLYSSSTSLSNPFQLSPTLLSSRVVIPIHFSALSSSTTQTTQQKPLKSILKKSQESNKTSHNEDNSSSHSPHRMCVYKLIKVKLDYWPISNVLQNILHNNLEAFYMRSFETSLTDQEVWKKLPFPSDSRAESTPATKSPQQTQTSKQAKNQEETSPQKVLSSPLQSNGYDYCNSKESNEPLRTLLPKQNKFQSKL